MRVLLAGVAAGLLFAGTGSAAPKPPPTFSEITTYRGTQVAVGQCIEATARSQKDDKALLETIGASAISKGLNLLGSAINNAAAEKTWSVTASRNFEATAEKFPQCLQIARGTFGNAAQTNTWTLSGWKTEPQAVLNGNGLFLTQRPDFLFEAEIVQSQSDKGVLALKPLRVSFGEPIGSRALRSGDTDREIAVFVSFSAPGTKPTLATNPGATILVGPMQAYTSRTFPGGVNGAPSIRPPLEAAWFTIGKMDGVKPLTASVMVSETQGEDKFLKFIGSVFGDKPVQEALNQLGQVTFLPGAAAAQEVKDDNAEDKARSAAMLKFAAAVDKLKACAKTANPTTDGAAAGQALRDYMTANRDLKTPSTLISQAMVDTVDPTKPATVKAACQAILDKIDIT